MPAYYKKTAITSTNTSAPAVLTNNEALPVAAFTSSYSVLTGTFNASSSTTGAPGGIIKYAWDFGDGTYKYGQTATRVFSKPGTYSVTLTITDSSYRTATVTNNIVIKATIADYFNRSDSSTLGTAADGTTSKAWTMIPSGNTVGIVSNQAKATAGTATMIAYVDNGTTGGTVQATLSSLFMDHGRSALIAFRVVDISNFWIAQLFYSTSNGGNGIRILRKVSGSNTTPWMSDITLSVGDVIKITDDGTLIRLYVNNILQTQTAISDTTLNTGTKVGIGGSFASDSVTGFDDFLYYPTSV